MFNFYSNLFFKFRLELTFFLTSVAIYGESREQSTRSMYRAIIVTWQIAIAFIVSIDNFNRVNVQTCILYAKNFDIFDKISLRNYDLFTVYEKQV